ncbi:FtsX-like permease family protein [Pendulispora albinea]|uniref:ABC transporter permease n=1 Tax=Pendulispora albinea TaxID=2741071 RepID=A0ABZ2M5A0_9BACT
MSNDVAMSNHVQEPARWAGEDIEQPWTPGEGLGVAGGALKRHFGSMLLRTLGLYLATFLLPLFPIFDALLAEGALAAVRDAPLPPRSFGRLLVRALRLAGFRILTALAVLLLPGLVFGTCALAGVFSPWEYTSALPALAVGLAFRLKFAFTPFFIVEDDRPLFEAMRRSWKATSTCMVSIFFYDVMLLPIYALGLVPIVGSTLSLGLERLGHAYGYARATGRNELPWQKPDYAAKIVRRYLRIIFVTLLAVFAVLTAWIRTLPTLRGSAWSLKDTILRAGAIVSSVTAILIGLALLLPYVLDRLERRGFSSFVGARHIRAQKSGFLTVISALAICGVALSSCSLSSVVNVMGGFGQDLKRKILGNNAHIVIDMTSQSTWEGYDDVLTKVRLVPGVTGATPVVHGEGMISSPSNLSGVIVRGVDPGTIGGVIELPNNIEVGKFEYLEHPEKLAHLAPDEVIGLGSHGEQFLKGTELGLPDDIDPQVRDAIMAKPVRPGIIIGRELAKTLHVYVGDEVTLVSALGDLGPMGIMPRTRKFRIAAIFFSGMYEYDASHVYTTLDVADEYFALGNKVHAIDVKVENAERADAFTGPITDAMARPELRVRDWREINRNLFSALKLERFATFIILSIAIIVASFGIICTLLLMVTEKGKEIAILKALGARDRSIMQTFMTEGIIIGAIGTTFGLASALSLCTGLKWFGLRLDPDVYYIDRLPINVDALDFLSVGVAAMVICTLATVYPAYAASTLRPMDGLRYE